MRVKTRKQFESVKDTSWLFGNTTLEVLHRTQWNLGGNPSARDPCRGLLLVNAMSLTNNEAYEKRA